MADSDIFVRFGADIEPLKKGAKQASNALADVGEKSRQTANLMGKMAVAAAAAGAAIGVKFVKDSLGAIDAQAKLAKQLGTSSSSLATLNRAADMSGISMKNIEMGAKNLEVALGEAAQGTGIAVDTLERLNLTAQDLQGLTLDEKILKVNKALKENIPAAERAAAASDLFGKRAGFAIMQLDPSTIAEATRQVQGMGLAISDFDAAKIEAANDAMATVGLAVEGVSQQFTVALAPILEDIALRFQEAAIESGGFKTQAIEAVNGVAAAVGFLGNAFRGIEVAIAALDVGFQTLKTGALGIGAIFSDSMAQAADEATASMATSIAEMNALLMEPLPSETIEAYISSFTDPAILEAKQAQVNQFKAIDEQDAMERIAREEQTQSAMAQIRQAWGKQQTSAVSQMFGDLATLMQSGSKKQFEIGKAAARAQTVMSTYEGAQKAYTALAGIPIVGPGLGAAAAAAAIAAGGIRLQAINSTSFGGGGSVSAGGAGGAVSADSGGQAQAQAPAQDRTIRIEGFDSGQLFTGDQLNSLAEKLVEYQDDGFRLVV